MTYPVFLLKRQARRLARDKNQPLHQALDEIARREGYQAWSHLVAASNRQAVPDPAIFAEPGEVLLIGARPSQGKTLFGLGLAADAVRAGFQASIFSLECTEPTIRRRLERMRRADDLTSGRLRIDLTEGLDADHIMTQLQTAKPGDVAVVDYLQLLDQNRRSPTLRDQVARLRGHARDRRLRLAFLSQIDRRFELSGKPVPDYSDIRRLDALGTGLFDKACFLHKGKTSLVTLPPSG
ncbi:replicative DNA helicase [Rhizobium sp. SG_E_25_P2]|uniref:DNA helicase n=1 Tax=Rhizobium sp. SG_E_25_P2 TaxID=2879942 RepID=UPI002475DC5C|nr:DNA helicase [Rhizobium sp. SG_E_25_P2]MDH6264864.1 replicative DNA helicase [Rhizobium sp. SG_E_25_P2]